MTPSVWIGLLLFGLQLAAFGVSLWFHRLALRAQRAAEDYYDRAKEYHANAQQLLALVDRELAEQRGEPPPPVH